MVPARSIVSKAWGDESTNVQFAGQNYFFSGLTNCQQQRIAHRFSCCKGDNTVDGTFVTEMSRGELPLQDPQVYSVDNFYTPLCHYRPDGVDVEGFGFLATINLSAANPCRLIAEEENKAVEAFIFENYLRLLAAYASLQQGGLLLHSAGIIVSEKAYIFLGRSGAGKSTLSKIALADGHTLLSDDANILLPAVNGFQAGPVPFAGELGQVNTNYTNICPVAGIYWLEQSEHASIAEIKLSLQTARSIACCPVVNVDSYRFAQVLKNVHSLLQSVPMQVLHFHKNQPFSVIRQLIEK
jgi:hypothetical protein